MRLFLKALAAFLVLPGVVAFAIPLGLLKPSTPAFHPAGLALAAIGTVLLLWCVRDFYIAGKGTLAPWSPPGTLVVVGLYRWSRNPMYVSVLMILAGWAAAFASPGLALYALIVMVAFHLRVVLAEEPWLAQRYGDAWDRYRSNVARWLIW
jgi:protein-S-isoprenylcysteine O-methyltransferase Ste14